MNFVWSLTENWALYKLFILIFNQFQELFMELLMDQIIFERFINCVFSSFVFCEVKEKWFAFSRSFCLDKFHFSELFVCLSQVSEDFCHKMGFNRKLSIWNRLYFIHKCKENVALFLIPTRWLNYSFFSSFQIRLL